jgi:hypothetical protein
LFNFWDCITQNRRCTSSRSIFQWEICSICWKGKHPHWESLTFSTCIG